MAARVVTKMISAATVAVAVELTDAALDRAGLTAGKYRIFRKVLRAALKSAVGYACGAALGKVFEQTEHGASTQAPGVRPD